jgi:hypothetical protein
MLWKYTGTLAAQTVFKQSVYRYIARLISKLYPKAPLEITVKDSAFVRHIRGICQQAMSPSAIWDCAVS